MPESTAAHAAPSNGPAALRSPAAAHLLIHLLTPLVLCLGMGLAYMSALASPAPHHMAVTVVADNAKTKAFAQTLKDTAGAALDVTTVPNRATAAALVADRATTAAYVPATHELIVAKAASETSASAAETAFTKVAAEQGAPLGVTDLAPTAAHDPTGQGLFFLLVALSIGSYASAGLIGATTGALPMRIRLLFAAAMSAVVATAGTLLGAPVFHVLTHGLWTFWPLAWLYSGGIILIGVGLFPFLKRWTTLVVTVLFVMLNFTSSGGIFTPDLQNGFFGALHTFWNGAALLETVRTTLYFPDAARTGHILTLFAWLAAGALLCALAALAERRRRPAPAPAPEPDPVTEEEIETVAA
ncbi:hypothetical protein EDD29_6111 [Actinocorallia herbida]|uniref:ABC-2 family transporter n=1 Tax=Actinocorallia herbida TaxID=58109 RepID=A0A3N1D4H4_9ACTN|nr:hypothetical protein [Actinocorallia herbida]ROO88442.1 hypothetical protein EDD29_6111 [Actinocorallia herbida]